MFYRLHTEFPNPQVKHYLSQARFLVLVVASTKKIGRASTRLHGATFQKTIFMVCHFIGINPLVKALTNFGHNLDYGL
jgi:hypothetical protein